MDFDELFGKSDTTEKKLILLQGMVEKFAAMMLGTAEVVDNLERQIWAIQEQLERVQQRIDAVSALSQPDVPLPSRSVDTEQQVEKTGPSTSKTPVTPPPPPPSSKVSEQQSDTLSPPPLSTIKAAEEISSKLPPLPQPQSFQEPPKVTQATVNASQANIAPSPSSEQARERTTLRPSPMALQAQLKNELAEAFKKIRSKLDEED